MNTETNSTTIAPNIPKPITSNGNEFSIVCFLENKTNSDVNLSVTNTASQDRIMIIGLPSSPTLVQNGPNYKVNYTIQFFETSYHIRFCKLSVFCT